MAGGEGAYWHENNLPTCWGENLSLCLAHTQSSWNPGKGQKKKGGGAGERGRRGRGKREEGQWEGKCKKEKKRAHETI